MAQSSYCFPSLDVKDILAYLKLSNGEDVTEKDLNDPQKERWQAFYTQMLTEAFMNFTPDSLHQGISSSEEFSYPELFEDAVPIINLHNCMQILMRTCGYDNFTMNDIICPTKKRLIKICSAVINFIRFKDERDQEYQQFCFENEAEQEERDSLIKENESLLQQINAIKAARAEKEPEIKRIQDALSERNETVSIMKQSISSKQQDIDSIKMIIAEKKTALARQNEQLAVVKQENATLSAQIVPSPDRMKGEMERMSRQLSQGLALKEEAQNRLRDVRTRRQLQQQRETESLQAIKLAENIKQLADKQKKLQRDIADQKDDASSKRDQIKHLDAKMQQIKLQLRTKQEKLEKMTFQHNHKLADMRSNLDQLNREKENRAEFCSSQQEAVKDLMCRKELIASEICREVKDHTEDMQLLGKKYHESLQQLDLYHDMLGKSWEKIKGTF